MIMSTLFPKMILRERMLMAYPASFLSVYALFFINFISGGKVFSNSILMVVYFSALSLMFFAKIISKKRMKETVQFLHKRITLIVLLSCGVVIYSIPILLAPSGIVWMGGDMRSHIEIVSQFILGQLSPQSVYQGRAQSYPWLFHIIVTAYHSFFSVQGIEQVQSIFLSYNVVGIITIVWGFIAVYALSDLSFRNDRKRTLIGTFLGFLSGGLGFYAYQGGSVLGSDTPFGDMMINFPYNGSLTLVIPAWPRQLGYVAFISAIYFIAKRFNADSDKSRVLDDVIAGINLGICAFLQPIPYVVSGVVLGLLFINDLRKMKINYDVILTSIVSALILLPWLISFILQRYGASASTRMEPLDLQLYEIPMAIGQAFFFGLLGLYVIVKDKKHSLHSLKNVINIYAYVFIIFIIISNVCSLLNVDVVLFGEYLFRQHRFWFLFYPIIVLYATEGFMKVFEVFQKFDDNISLVRLSRVASKIKPLNKVAGDGVIQVKPLTVALLLFLIAFGAGSPIYTSWATSNSIAKNSMNTQFSGSGINLITIINSNLGVDDVIAVRADRGSYTPDYIACFTGAHLLYTSHVRSNSSNWEIPNQRDRFEASKILFSSTSSMDEKLAVINRFNITRIISIDSLTLPNNFVYETYQAPFLGRNFILYIIKKND
jgi:hypothetical protein